TAIKNVFLPSKKKMRESKTPAGEGVLESPRETSPEQPSFRESVPGRKTSEMETNEVLAKLPTAPSSRPNVPAKDAKQPPFLRVIRRSGSTKSGSKTHTEKSEKDQASSLSSNKPTKDRARNERRKDTSSTTSHGSHK
ncbi:hypothetical protein GCK32_015386, partial [Trichostrongylus colubriformis]